jgi:hypothetical protein
MAVFPGLNQKIKDAVTKLEEQLVSSRFVFLGSC